MNSKRVALVFALCSLLVIRADAVVWLHAAAAGGGPTKTFDTEHNSDSGDWVGYSLACTEDAASSGDLSPGGCWVV